jgi:Fe-S-cluster-containing hydrogenase component 2
LNLLDAAERISDLGSGGVRYRPERCLHAMVRDLDCEGCWICPTDAVSETKPPLVDISKCEQCLACLPACPTGAFSGVDHHKGMLRCIHRMEARSVELLCHLHPAQETGPAGTTAICMGACLASLGRSAYLSMAALGVETLVMRMDACEGCPLGDLVPQIKSQVQDIERLMTSAALDSFQVTIVEVPESGNQVEREVWNADNPPLTRRDLFKVASGVGGRLISQMIEDEAKGSNLGRDRIRSNNAFRQLLSAEKFPFNATVEDFGYAVLSVDENCTACGTCARICPTGALTLRIYEEHFTLDFSAEACIACGLCAESCTPEAITISLAPTYTQIFKNEGPLTLLEGDLIKCIRCGTRIAAWTTSRMCPVCEFRSLHPFGSQLPPGVRRDIRSGDKHASDDPGT